MLLEKALQLTTPIKSGEQEITELTLREPTAGNLKACQTFEGHDLNIRLIALTSTPKIDHLVAANLSYKDYTKAIDVLDELMGRTKPPTESS